jgi:phosphate transport system permease protein
MKRHDLDPVLPGAPQGGSLRRRGLLDRLFTGASVGSVLLIALALALVLAPMLWRGTGAVVFSGTVEFRKMQLENFNRGHAADVEAELATAQAARAPVYEMLNRFSRGLDTQRLQDEAQQISLEFSKQLDQRDLAPADRTRLRSLSRRLRDALIEAYEAPDKAAASERLQWVLDHALDPGLKGSVAEGFVRLAHDYQHVLATVDLSYREDYAAALKEVHAALRELFGPPPGDRRPTLPKDQYGATRWDMAERAMHKVLFARKWVSGGPGQPLHLTEMPREEQFAGTELAPLFPRVRDHADEMLRPQTTVYWQYFIDGPLSGHYFGGVGPEILGTLLLTLVAVALAFPLGLVSAACLVEVAGDGRLVHIIRTCINTLAGVPSIVFGLFGLAFVVLWLLPLFGLKRDISILAGGITLALLVLPVIIRASEEAIRSVPPAYKEAALALGAGRFRCFMTVTLPAALPGILTGVILSISRAAGETAPILFTAAVAVGQAAWPVWPGLARGTPTLSYTGFNIAVGDTLGSQVPHNQYGVIMTLIVLVLILNLAAIALRWRVARKLRGH